MGTHSPEDQIRRYISFLNSPEKSVDRGFSDRLRSKLETETDIVEQLRLLSAIELAERVDGRALQRDFVAVAAQYAKEHSLTPGAFASLGVPEEVLLEAGLLGADEAVDLATVSAVTRNVVSARNGSATESSNGHGATMTAVKEWEYPATDGDLSDEIDIVDDLDDTDVIDDNDDLEDTGADDLEEFEAQFADPYPEPTPAPKTVIAQKPVPAPRAVRVVEDNDEPEAGTRRRVTQSDIVRLLPEEPFTIKAIVDLSGASQLTVRKTIENLQDAGKVRAVGSDPSYTGVGRSPMRYQLSAFRNRVASA